MSRWFTAGNPHFSGRSSIGHFNHQLSANNFSHHLLLVIYGSIGQHVHLFVKRLQHLTNFCPFFYSFDLFFSWNSTHQRQQRRRKNTPRLQFLSTMLLWMRCQEASCWVWQSDRDSCLTCHCHIRVGSNWYIMDWYLHLEAIDMVPEISSIKSFNEFRF